MASVASSSVQTASISYDVMPQGEKLKLLKLHATNSVNVLNAEISISTREVYHVINEVAQYAFELIDAQRHSGEQIQEFKDKSFCSLVFLVILDNHRHHPTIQRMVEDAALEPILSKMCAGFYNDLQTRIDLLSNIQGVGLSVLGIDEKSYVKKYTMTPQSIAFLLSNLISDEHESEAKLLFNGYIQAQKILNKSKLISNLVDESHFVEMMLLNINEARSKDGDRYFVRTNSINPECDAVIDRVLHAFNNQDDRFLDLKENAIYQLFHNYMNTAEGDLRDCAFDIMWEYSSLVMKEGMPDLDLIEVRG